MDALSPLTILAIKKGRIVPTRIGEWVVPCGATQGASGPAELEPNPHVDVNEANVRVYGSNLVPVRR